ncbi:TrkH family potassium uptake protein [Rhodosalinus sediminis]|uniref:TrkH family potassium uptake protein n=1 Tax=Rhodosalinus sediminis TaxID=1940533 RepID=A0A3D9BVW9_9RHOB|nr:potassium transporter TrkG [Rhodosalinus sediminis]REC57649.1 TrkH family potassium uptake protein [Rhodosalinus sediminis]
MARLWQLPLVLLLAGVFCVSMVVPAAVALAAEEYATARAFFYAGLLGTLFVVLVAVARGGRPPERDSVRQLLALLVVFLALPAGLAVPFHEAVRTTSFLNAYVEMVSCLTTTGATLFEPERLSPALHLWRAQVAWLGGLLIWTAAAAILAPLSLGGFEVTASGEPGRADARQPASAIATPQMRLARAAGRLAPVYAVLTLVLWLLLMAFGEAPMAAAIHAMSTISTSGISEGEGVVGARAGLLPEIAVFAFLFLALSRLTFSSDTLATVRTGLRQDPEFRLGLVIVVAVPLVLFLRHWAGAYEVGQDDSLAEAARALWGASFTVASFLTTTGFVSADWQAAQLWSGLGTPGLVLMGLAILGGGVATTAGGVKLLRIYALYLHGLREMEKLVHPSSVGRAGGFSRRLRRQGAFIAFVFFMLFALSLMVASLVFAAFGSGFEEAMVLAVAGLTTTGPLVVWATEAPVALADLAGGARLAFAGTMVLGRFELLAIVALLSPALWRR